MLRFDRRGKGSLGYLKLLRVAGLRLEELIFIKRANSSWHMFKWFPLTSWNKNNYELQGLRA